MTTSMLVVEDEPVVDALGRRHLGDSWHMPICFPADDLPTLLQLVARLSLAIYLVLFLSLSGLVYTERWAEGAHVTPEMWAEHTQLVRLGYVDHHDASDDATGHIAHDRASRSPAPLLLFMPTLGSLPRFPLAVEWNSYLTMFGAIAIAALIIVRIVLIRADDAFEDYYPPTLHRPPIAFS